MTTCCSLLELEIKIEQGLQGYYEAGQALLEIRERGLYRESHTSFEAYCQERWCWSKAHVYRLMSASQTVEALPDGDRPQSEWQTRPLTLLPPEQRAAAWAAAQAIAGPQPSGPTVERVTTAVKAGKSWEVGQELTVKEGDKAGEIVKISRVDGVIVWAEGKPFLATELTDQPTVVEAAPAWTAKPTKPDRLEALEAELELAQTRLELLEQMLSRLAMAAGPWLNSELLAEVHELLA